MANKQTIKNKQKQNIFSSKERKAFYIGFGLGLTDNMYFVYPTARKYINNLSKKESDSFSNGFHVGSNYKDREKNLKLEKLLKQIKNTK